MTSAPANRRTFQFMVYTPAGSADPSIAIAAGRAGGLGVVDLEYVEDEKTALAAVRAVSRHAAIRFGIKLNGEHAQFVTLLSGQLPPNLSTVIITPAKPQTLRGWVETFHAENRIVLLEATSAGEAREGTAAGVDGLIAKGHEACGLIGEKTTFILLQQMVSTTRLPVFAQGGIGLHTAAACYAAGAAGVVLDTQLLLTRESPLRDDVKRQIAAMDGSESRVFGENTKHPVRLFVRPGSACLDEFRKGETFSQSGRRDGIHRAGLREIIRKYLSWDEVKNPCWLLGQDAGIAAGLAKKYASVGSILRAFKRALHDHIQTAKKTGTLEKDSPLAKSHGTIYPVVQGPMARITDSAAFASRVAEEGALPFIALSQLKGTEIGAILPGVKAALGDRPWGVGILGFNREDLFREQLEALSAFSPPFAILAGGRPDQVSLLESRGTATYLHVPSPGILDILLAAGTKKFIFEGSECGGHIGPRSSFVLWDTMTEKLIDFLKTSGRPNDFHILYAGGIHDSLSASMAAVISAPLADAGARIGVLMGTAYLLTPEIVESGAILDGYQQKVLDCIETAVLDFSPGHALRCCITPLSVKFGEKKRELSRRQAAGTEMSAVLGQLLLGKSRIAAKGLARTGEINALAAVDGKTQHEDGLYMTGQLAALNAGTRTIRDLHEAVTIRACERLVSLLPYEAHPEAKETKPCDIAIIGMACLFPAAGDLRTYWQNILSKKNAITEVPRYRWDWRMYYDEDRNAKDKIYSRWGGFLDEVFFDPARYGLPPKSMESIDPMQLMALEVARRTLADAGYEDREFDRETASVILGASGAGDFVVQYGLRSELPRFSGELPDDVAKRLPEWTEDSFPGILLNVITGRIANRLNLGGANFITDAACASSLAAVYQGVGELAAGRSSMVIAGGVDAVQGPFGYLCFSKARALSPRGSCSTFDVAADGIVISEGIAMVAMKRLEDAERDGDRIYAVIKGVGASSDGKARGLTAPLPAGQLRAMRRAYEQAGFGPQTVSLFEAHGTGTVVGDTAELESTSTLLREALGRTRGAAIGSVKTLIGHTKAAAGIAGLIKSTLALHHRVLPPHGVDQPNPVLEQQDSLLYLPDQPMPWLSDENGPRLAAVSAFGFGGTNFHVVLEEYEVHGPDKGSGQAWPSELLLWHGKDREELIAGLGNTQHELETGKESELYDIARTLSAVYRTGGHTVAIVAADAQDLAKKIHSAVSFLTGKIEVLPQGVFHGEPSETGARAAVLFPGQGSQYTGMSRELALYFPVYADMLSEADGLLSEPFARRFGGARLSHFIFPRGCYSERAKARATKALTGTDVAQPALGAMGAGLWKLMESFGLRARMAGGHSYGEFTALFAGGVIGFDALLSLSEARGRSIVDAITNTGGEFGTMAAIRAPRDYVEKAISDIDGLVVANHNAPRQCVISGPASAIERASERMALDGVSFTKIPVSAAFHSRFVKPAQSALAEVIGKINWRKADIPVYSNTTGEPHPDDAEEIKRVMTEHLVRPVEFVAEIEAMYRDGARVFLELGPKSVLTKLVDGILDGRPHKAVAIDGNGGGMRGFLAAFGQLLCAGISLDARRLFDSRGLPAAAQAGPSGERELKRGWLLNGSCARRADEPLRQVGVTMDDLRGREKVTRAETATRPAAPESKDIFRRRPASRKLYSEKVGKGGRKEMPIDDEQSVMAAYFNMMRQFLETQERIMSMHLSGTPQVRRSGPRLPHFMPNRAFPENPGPGPGQVFPFNPEMRPGAAEETHVKTEAPPASGPRNSSDAVSPPKERMPAVPAQNPAGRLDRGKLTGMLLGIIEEKTGYPPDMIGMNQDLEADLGIDSIKRVEIVGALMKALPPVYGQMMGKDAGRLNTQATLNGMLDILEKAEAQEAAVPFDQAGMGPTTCVTAASRSFRHIMKPKQEPIQGHAAKRLPAGHFIVTADRLSVAGKLSELLRAHGCTVTLVERDILGDEERLNKWCLSLEPEGGPIAGIAHLAQIGSDQLPVDTPVEEWRRQLGMNEKSIFILLHDLSGRLTADAHVLSASSLGGLFSRDENNMSGLFLQGGSPGLLKSLSEERPRLRVKAVDLDPALDADTIAVCLLEELGLERGRQEVGYPHGMRTIFETVAESLPMERHHPGEPTGRVVLATGGMKGVTAELLRELALPGNTLILTGRSPLEQDDPPEVKAFATPEALQEHFVSEVRKGSVRMSPAEIRRKVKSVLVAREMRSNIDDFRKHGAAVEYHAVDVTNDDAMRKLFDGIYGKYSRITDVVHGAGIIEDKLLADKKSDSWSRVVETKVLGLLLLQKYLRPESLRFFGVMSSVAGRYGNSGQSDYATANELMNRLCCQLSRIWGNRVNVKAFCWGPWGRTKFGPGMVTPEMEAKFAAKGVSLVTAEAGREVFRKELMRGAGPDIEVICGEGPWEEREAKIGGIEPHSQAQSSEEALLEDIISHAPVCDKPHPSGVQLNRPAGGADTITQTIV